MSNESIEVPLARAKFQRYRDMNAVTAALGPGMILCILGRGWYLLGSEFRHPRDLDFLLLAVFMASCIILFIGLATVPAWQLACTQTKMLKQDLPALRVTTEGIWDYSSNYVFGFIPWTEITDFIVTERSGSRGKQTYPGIAFVVKNKDVLLKRQPGLMGMWLGSDNEITDRRQVFIPQGRIDVPIEVVAPLITDFRRRLTQGNTEQILPNVRQ